MGSVIKCHRKQIPIWSKDMRPTVMGRLAWGRATCPITLYSLFLVMMILWMIMVTIITRIAMIARIIVLMILIVITTLEWHLYLSCDPRPCPGRHRSSAWTDVEVGSLPVDRDKLVPRASLCDDPVETCVWEDIWLVWGNSGICKQFYVFLSLQSLWGLDRVDWLG